VTVENLLAFIRKPESRGDYNIVWSEIKAIHRPPRRLVDMTIGDVLSWQDSIDHLYMSEAAGAYQFMEDTLRGLYSEAGLRIGDMMNVQNQDALAVQLLKRRGLVKYQRGEISAETFANNLAMEWASLPVVTRVKRTAKGRTWTVQPGASYYAGDGRNAAHVTVDAFMAAVRAVRATDAPPAPSAPETQPGRWARWCWSRFSADNIPQKGVSPARASPGNWTRSQNAMTQVDSASDDRTANNAVRHTYRILTDAEKQSMVELKDLGAAFIAKCDAIGGSRELSLAKTNAEQAVMWAVKHVTA